MEEPTGSISSTKRCLLSVFCGRTSLLVLMTGYALLGAILFKSIEGGDEYHIPHDFQRSREDCLKELWLITERLNVLYEKNWTKLVTEQLKRFEKAVMDSGRIEGVSSSGKPHWTFGGALLYSVTLLTTVGYGKLSPKTALGKVVAIIYAIIGVPLMLILLSALGSLLATGARKSYSRLCCQNQNTNIKSPAVGYHKAPSSPVGKLYCRTHEDSASIHLHSSHPSPNHHINCLKSNHLHYPEPQEIPKRAVLATVRTNRAGWRRQGPIRQTLSEAAVPVCSAHAQNPIKQSAPMLNHVTMNSSVVGITTGAELDEEDGDENEHVCCAHDTPSRMPLIYRCPENSGLSPPPHEEPSPSVPALIVLIILASYVCAGALAFSSTSGWGFLDAIYFCFIALSTIGLGDKLPQSGEFHAQMHLYACCLYLILGLVVVSMCFSLVQEEVTLKCRQFANSLGLLRH